MHHHSKHVVIQHVSTL